MSGRNQAPHYNDLPIAEKRAEALSRAREPSVVCPICDVHTTSRDLLEHLAKRCSGRREPHPGCAWVTWRQARALGTPRNTLSRWAKAGLVRSTGPAQDRRYLLRDLATCLAWRTLLRRARQRR